MPVIRSVDDLPFYGGALCLDLANTVEWRDRPEALDTLGDAAALARWGARAGLTTAAGERGQLETISADPAQAGRELARARSLREAVHRAFSRVARGERPTAGDLAEIRASHAEGVCEASLVAGPDGGWRAAWDAADLRLARFSAAASAWELLADGRLLARVGRCEGSGCGWLFLDRSRGGRRRWCSMGGCGSREKMRRLYARRSAR